jgi:nicotinate phosphoribosyltransferase
MMQAVLHRFPDTEAEYEFVCRSGEDLRPFKTLIEREIYDLGEISFDELELSYLKSIRFLKPDFIDFLRIFRLNPKKYVKIDEGGTNLTIKIKGPWLHTILFEVPILAIISEVYQTCGKEKIDIDVVSKNRNSIFESVHHTGVPLSDFGTRRRASFELQSDMLEYLMSCGNFIGTSNVLFAMQKGLKPIGTMAHEWIQAGQGLNKVQLKNSQQFMLEEWIKEYRGDLGIALTDTISTKAFLNDFDLYLAKLYDGVRHDSGDPFQWGNEIIEHYKKLKIDPETKTLVFSDSLTIEKANSIYNYFKNRANVSFGIGTHLTNYTNIKPISMVIKLVKVNGNPVAKLSNNPEKTICKDKDYLKYLKHVFEV